MRKLLIFLFLLSSIGCYCQIDRLSVYFYPSFIDRADVVIEKKESGYSVTISNGKIYEECSLKEASLSDLQYFFVDYFNQKHIIDSIGYAYKQELAKKGTFIIHLDGITVNGYLVDKYGERWFAFKSPNNGTIDHMFMVVLFKLLNSTFKKSETVKYVERLGNSFDVGLGLKKLSERPLKYKLYGSLSSDYENELLDFFSKLPTDKKIIFDFSNISFIDANIYKSFKSIYDLNPKIKWINCSDFLKEKLLLAGIKLKSIK